MSRALLYAYRATFLAYVALFLWFIPLCIKQRAYIAAAGDTVLLAFRRKPTP